MALTDNEKKMVYNWLSKNIDTEEWEDVGELVLTCEYELQLEDPGIITIDPDALKVDPFIISACLDMWAKHCAPVNIYVDSSMTIEPVGRFRNKAPKPAKRHLTLVKA